VILFILPNFSGGGAERVIINLLTGLHNDGYSVEIIVFDKIGPLSTLVPSNISVHNLKTKTLKKSIFPLIVKIWRLRPKIIFSTFGYINITLLFLKPIFPKALEIWVREANLPSISLKNNPFEKLMIFSYRILYKKSNKLICTSKRMRDEFIFDFKVPKEILDIIPNPVDTDKIRNSSLPVMRFDKGGVCYVASGRLTYQKGFDRLLKLFSLLSNKKSTLVILGDGQLKNELICIAKSLNIQSRVKFIGFCNNPWVWYAGADVFLLSSRWEGMPNSVLESLACGTRVVATYNSGGVLELKEKALPGAVMVSNNSEEFFQYMEISNIDNSDLMLKNVLLPKEYHFNSALSLFKNGLNL